MTRKSSKKGKRDLYQEMTDKIVEALEAGVAPWVCPWDKFKGPLRNGASGHHYRGSNVLMLALTSLAKGFTDSRWYTFKQVSNRKDGSHVRKGEKSSRVVWWKVVTKEDKETGKEESKLFMRSYCVFNHEQIEWAEEEEAPVPFVPSTPTQEVEALIAAAGAEVVHKGNKAAYYKKTDTIRMPPREKFEDEGSYCATVLHELVHWTAKVSRCDRPLDNRFGSEAYAFEELVAELGSAFLCAHFGIAGQLQHEEYVGHWIKTLKNDKYAVYRAAKLAQNAVDFILESLEIQAREVA